MRLAYVSVDGRGRTDHAMAGIAAHLAARGLRVAGAVRADIGNCTGHPCDMDLQVLPDGPLFRVSQPLGPQARGCRLDTAVLADIALAVEASLSGAQVLVINKFGKQEAQGRGLLPTIVMALDRAMPVIVGVNKMNLQDFTAFSGGLAREMPTDPDAALDWVRDAC